MSPTIFSLSKGFSILLTGIVIKILDDSLDREIDEISGRSINPLITGKGTMPYTLLILSLACVLDVETSAGLFMAGYALGMSWNLTAIMPSGVRGYQESIGIIILGCLVFGLSSFLSSVFIVATLQLLDDDIDYFQDLPLNTNWSFILGRAESRLLALISFLTSLYLDAFKAILVMVSYFIIIFIFNGLNINAHNYREEDFR